MEEGDSCSGTQPEPFHQGMNTDPPVISSANTGEWTGGELGLLSSCNSMMTIRKEWPALQYPHHIHPTFPSRDLPYTAVSQTAESCGSYNPNSVESGVHGWTSPSMTYQHQQPQPLLPDDTAGCTVSPIDHFMSKLSSHTSHSTNSPQFREMIEMLLNCYMEFGGTVRSEEFRNLVEAFLCPVFESLNTIREASKTRSGSSASSSTSQSQTPCLAGPSSSTASASCPSSSTAHMFESISGCYFPAGNFGSNSAMHDADRIGMLEQDGDSWSCPACYGILVDPVTIPCGHTYCKKCLQRENAGQTCRRCEHVLTSGDIAQCKTNVLLGSLVEKWWKDEVAATRLRNEGNSCFEEKDVEQALRKYSEALNLVPGDHLSLGNRSHALLTAGRSEEALEDAEAAARICPMWPKGYFRKSSALISLGKYEEAFLSLTVCMYLMKLVSSMSPVPKDDPAQSQVINEMIKILQKLFLQSTASVGSTLKRHNTGEQLQFTPYPHGRKISDSHGRYERRPRGLMRTSVGPDSEYNSDDEGDYHPHQPYQPTSHVYSSSAPNNFDFGSSWACWKQPSRLPHQMNISRHLVNFPGNIKGNNYSNAAIVDQLSLKMTRLFGRANQDLKSFESRLTVLQSKTSLRNVDVNVISSNDLECSLCYRLLFQPVSTGCGHTFCRSCLDRCLDHNPACPLCKASLRNYLASRGHAVTEFLEAALTQNFPKEFEERRKQHLEELYSLASTEDDETLRSDIIPIFVCTMAFPTIPCLLHVFEPRYRLMIRRCMENGTKRFGMCCALSEGRYGDIGTVLEIKDSQIFKDGRSVVVTVGIRRFKILRKIVKDGYNAAKIEIVEDRPIEASEIPVLKELHDQLLKEALEWFPSIGQARRQIINLHFGDMPPPQDDWLTCTDGPSWAWWLLAILPVNSEAQLSILRLTNLRKRMESMLNVLLFVNGRPPAAVAE